LTLSIPITKRKPFGAKSRRGSLFIEPRPFRLPPKPTVTHVSTMSEAERTISGAFNWGSRLLKERGIESPRVDAELLLREALKMDQVELYRSSHRALTPPQFASYKSLINKRIRGEPIQYILGRREFWSLDLKVAPEVFIPRPETELVVEEALVEFIQGGCTDHRDPPLFNVITRIKDEKDIERVRDEIYAAIQETKTTPVSEERLVEIKSHMKYNFMMGLDTPGRIAGTMCHYLQMTADYETVNRVYDLYDNVTSQDIMDVAQKYFGNEQRTVVTLTHGGEK